eukprot:765839-Hanusia_phi.AAC.1
MNARQRKHNFFNYSKFLPRTQEFETRVRSISTDSVSLCIHIEKDKRAPINPTSEQPHGSTITIVKSRAAAGQTVVDNPRRVIAIDPGRANLICGVEVSPQVETIVHICSRGHYYKGSSIQKNNEKIKIWNKRAGDVNEALRTPSL